MNAGGTDGPIRRRAGQPSSSHDYQYLHERSVQDKTGGGRCPTTP